MPTAKFLKPPLNEVVMGITFQPISGFHSQHFGRFWEVIKNDYPKSQQAINYGEPPPLNEGEIFPHPRFWFISGSLDKLVQIQSNLFLCNWRKVDGEGVYPEYEEMKKVFKKNYSTFLNFLEQMSFEKPIPIELQFAYVNHFNQGQEWEKPSDLSNIIKSIGFPDTLVGKDAKNFDLNFAYPLPDDSKGVFRMKISTGKIQTNEKRIIVFENSARGLDPKDGDIFKWFDYSHEQLVNNFEKLTNSEMQNNLWKKQG